MKINQTIVCLTLITIVALMCDAGGIGLLLWVGYGLYRMDQNSQ